MTGCIIAVAKESLIGGVSADYQSLHILRQMFRCVRGHIICNDDLVGDILRML